MKDLISASMAVDSLAIPPRVTEEADRMMRKLRDLQNELEDRASELARKEAQINMLDAEREAATKKLRNAEGKHLVSMLYSGFKVHVVVNCQR